MRDRIQVILDMILRDLDRFEDDDYDDYEILVSFPSVDLVRGPVVPWNWIKDLPEYRDGWQKFMEGQSVVFQGVCIRDVQRFLHSKMRSL